MQGHVQAVLGREVMAGCGMAGVRHACAVQRAGACPAPGKMLQRHIGAGGGRALLDDVVYGAELRGLFSRESANRLYTAAIK
jgi:hypothetical protein